MAMKNIYLDINGDIIDEIFDIPVDPSNTRIDQILRDIVGIGPTKKRSKIETSDKDEKTKKTSKKSSKEKVKVKKITIKRIKG